jgi:hypothetical protein
METTKLAIFEQKEIRKIWDSKKWDWYFSIVDIIEVLTESRRPRKYWNDLKISLKEEGSELSENIGQLKMEARDWKKYNTDVLNTKNILRLIQSIPSKKAEPFKIWLAKVWDERINEIYDPEIAIERAISTYRKKWYSEDWIKQRLKSIDIRKELTGEWKNRGVEEWLGYAILTNEIIQSWSWMTTNEYKNFKWLKKESLKDNMTNLELIFNMLWEASSTQIMKTKDSKWFYECKSASHEWWKIACNARKELEEKSGESIIKKVNLLNWWDNKKLN